MLPYIAWTAWVVVGFLATNWCVKRNGGWNTGSIWLSFAPAWVLIWPLIIPIELHSKRRR